jgi:hypothetical protein
VQRAGLKEAGFLTGREAFFNHLYLLFPPLPHPKSIRGQVMFKKRKKNVRPNGQNGVTRSRKTSRRLMASNTFERLEDKRCLAFLGFFDGVTLQITQTANDGDALIENSTGVWRATDNAATFTFVAAQNVRLIMQDDTLGQVDFAVDLEHLGNVEIQLGNGARELFLSGALNEIGGNLDITSGTGDQTINLGPNASPIIHGNMSADLGSGYNIVLNNDNLLTVDGNLTLKKVNEFHYSLQIGLPGPPVTGGDVLIDNRGHDADEALLIPNGGGVIERDFTYYGGTNIDRVDLDSLTINRNVTIDLGLGNPFFGNPQLVSILGTVEGNVDVTAGDSNLGNDIDFLGAFNGNTVRYTGGNLVDSVEYSFAGVQADVFADLGGGDDEFILNVQVNYLEIDFGNDPGDVFTNNVLEKFLFNFKFYAYQQFDHFYTYLDDILVMNQLSDTGDIEIGNAGGVSGFDWTMDSGIGGFTSTVRTGNIVLTMLPNTLNDVDMNLSNPNLASITMHLGDGNRNVQFTGAANNPLRDIRINAGAGSQNVALSVNAPLGVATLAINLGTGLDTVTDNAGSLIINEDLFLTGVSTFVNSGLLSVIRNVNINNSVDVLPGLFQSTGTFSTGGTFTYTGGSASDRVLLAGVGGSNIQGATVINLGDATDGNPQQLLANGPNVNFRNTFTVTSTNASTLDEIRSVPTTKYLGNVSVNLGGGTNTTEFIGQFGGSTVAYTGGSGVDTVTYGYTGTLAALNMALGGGDDVFNLLAGSRIAGPLTIDFGTGNNTFNSTYGPFDFDANLLGLNDFNHSFVFATGTLTSTQILDLGPVTVDTNGPGGAVRFASTTTSTITPVNNLVINMLNGTSTLTVDLDSALAGFLNVSLGNGARTMAMTGASNSLGGSLTVNGGTGIQNIQVAVNSPLTVGGSMSISVGAGDDVVGTSGRNVSVTGNLQMTGVNSFTNTAAINAGGNVLFDVSGEAVNSSFMDSSPLTTGGNFTYIGSNANDTIVFSPTTNIGGNVVIDAKNGTNTAALVNIIGGTQVTYTGGDNADLVTYGMTGATPSLNLFFGPGDDVFTLQAGANVGASLNLDFGPGNNTFNNNFGAFTFNAQLNGLNGFNHQYVLATNSLNSTQDSDPGPVTVDNNGAGNAIRFVNGGTSTLTPVTHLTLNMLNGSATSLTLDLDNPHAGDLVLNLGDGGRTTSLVGALNSIGGSLHITGGTGSQTVNAAVNARLLVGANLNLDLGAGLDTFSTSANGMGVTGFANIAGVNSFNNGGNMTVGGSLTYNTSTDNENSTLTNTGTFAVGGLFTYTGGTGRDSILLTGAGGTTLGGDALINLGDNILLGTQTVDIGAPATLSGKLTVSSIATTNSDVLKTATGVVINGDIDVNLGGGTNELQLRGVFNGANVKFNGGSGNDKVTYGLTGNPVDPNIKLAAGDDQFIFEAGSQINNLLRVDFGGGADSFTNNYGNFDFDANLLNWNGFHRYYTDATKSLAMDQIANAGNLVLDNNGAGGAIRLFTGGTFTAMTAAEDVRLVLLDNTAPNVTVDLDSALVGDLILQLRGGNRTVSFTGSSNSVGGLLRVEAAAGDQTITLGTTNRLQAGTNLVINGRDGNDTVTNGTQNVVVGQDMLLRNINHFENNNTVTVGRDVNMVGVSYVEAAMFLNKGTFNVNRNFTYLGGTALDEVKFSAGSANISGFTYVDLGASADLVNRQVARFTGPFTTSSLQVTTGNSANGAFFSSENAMNVSGNVNVNFSKARGNNTAHFHGSYAGTFGNYQGGIGVDTVVFGAVANTMAFSSILNNGNDVFTFQNTASLDSAFIDFGGGADTFINLLPVPAPFPINVINL